MPELPLHQILFVPRVYWKTFSASFLYILLLTLSFCKVWIKVNRVVTIPWKLLLCNNYSITKILGRLPSLSLVFIEQQFRIPGRKTLAGLLLRFSWRGKLLSWFSSGGIGGIHGFREYFPSACPLQAYPGGPPGHRGQHWHQS